jgi:orotidine-5'-phosphate decarboxylase
MNITYIEKLRNVIAIKGSNLVAGLDTDLLKIPRIFANFSNPVLEFNKCVITATKDIVAGYKINTAFYEAIGVKGAEALEKTVKFIPDDMIKICDAKRGDIGNTSEMYARAYFDNLSFDSITFSPYMGRGSIQSFLSRPGKLVYVLIRTSNSGSGDVQMLKLEGKERLYERIAADYRKWFQEEIGFVIGANHTEDIKNYTESADIPLLIPGIGAQGNELEALMRNIRNNLFLINSSRSIIYPAGKINNKGEFISKIAENTLKINTEINKFKVF